MLRARRLRVGWILVGDENFGSSRLHGYNIHEYLRDRGFHSDILKAPKISTYELNYCYRDYLRTLLWRYDFIIFQKVFDNKAIRFATLLRKLGVKTVFVLCDLIQTEMISVVDRVIVTSKVLADYVYDQYKVKAIIIDDALETPAIFTRVTRDSNITTGVWVGSKDNWSAIARILKLVDFYDLGKMVDIVTVSDHEESKVKWSLENVKTCCSRADFGLIPIDDNPRAMAKSSNRLSMLLSLGLPVLAEKIPSYVDLASQTGGVVFVENDRDWCVELKKMSDPEYRKNITGDAMMKVREYLDMKVIGEQWLRALDSIFDGSD